MKSTIFTIFLLLSASYALKFNHPRILLPVFEELRINYDLEVVEKGCFDFRISSGIDLIKIEPIYDDPDTDCSYKVKITAISKEKAKKTAILLAESHQTGEVLRCDVILDVINKFGVHTTTRELYLEEAPEAFELMAQDTQGNDFTTLEGVEFNWKIGTQNRNTKETTKLEVLRFLLFSESKYHRVPKEVESFDSMGRRGHMTLIEGINTGSAKVIVKLPHAEYAHVPQVEVDITVLANLIIEPVDVHILVGDSVTFKVLQLKQGKLEEVVLGPQYYLEIEKKVCANIDSNLATGLKLGTTSVILRDKNVLDGSANPTMPKARLTVSEAAKITVNLLPYYNWVTVEHENHEIAFDLFTKNDERITLGTKYTIESSFDRDLFKEAKRTVNGTRIAGLTVTKGTCPITGKFNDLQASAQMIIHRKIDLAPTLVVIPYDIHKPINQRVKFYATGGDGTFSWLSGNSALVTMTSDGFAETHLEKFRDGGIMETNIKAALTRNTKIFRSAQMIFLPPVKLEIVAFHFEAAVGEFVDVHIGLFAMYNNRLTPYTSCDNLNFETEFTSQLFNEVPVESEGIELKRNACRVIRLKGVHAGLTSLTVSYHHGYEVLKDDVQLLVYEKLLAFNPERDEIVLPIGSSRNVIYQYGPRKTYAVGSELQKTLEYTKNLIEVSEIRADFLDHRFGYNVLCRKIGQTKIHLELFNSLNQDNFMKNPAIIETTVHCVKPRFINIYSMDNSKTSCPIDRKNSLLHVKSGNGDLDINIEILDAQKRKFDNISSLLIDWQFLQTSGLLNNNVAFNRHSDIDEIDGVPIPGRDYIRTSMSEVSTNHKIKAIVTDYDSTLLKSLKIVPDSPQFGIQKAGESQMVTPVIENEIDFLAFDASLLPFSSVAVFLSPGVVKRIKLGHGSGFYDIKIKHSSLLDVQLDKATNELILKPKLIGETILEISDKCLNIEGSQLHVSIVGIGKVELMSPDRVEKSKTIEAIAKLYDSNEKLLDIDHDNLNIYALNEKISNEQILSIKRDQSQENLQRGEIRYVVTGKELGETKVVVSSGSISSSPSTIQVFPPLQLMPRNVTILVGSQLEISARGGPKLGSNIIYSATNGDIAAMDGSIIEGLKVGKTKVVGKSVGENPIDGRPVVFTEDSIFVTVIPLNHILIKAPLKRLKSGSIMPLTLWADNEISPMVLGTLKNLRVQWQIDAPDVVELKDVFDEIGVVYGDSDTIAMRARGLKQGKARITATLLHANQKFKAIFDISVFKTLELESPKKIVHDPIIIPPRMNVQLKTNLDDTTFEIYDQADKNVINVSKDGTITSFETLGTCLVVASSSSNNQKLDIPVEVKKIHYVMASAVTSDVRMKGTMTQLPSDLNFDLTISLHDNLGNKFSHSLEEINWKLSNRNTVEIHNGANFTLNLKLLRKGSNMLAIALNNLNGIKFAEDFVKLSVMQGVSEDKIIATVGDIICLDSPLDDVQNWSTSSDSIQLYGPVAVVRSIPMSPKVSIYHGNKQKAHITYDIQLRNPDRVEFRKKEDVFNGEAYNGHFVVYNHQQGTKGSNFITLKDSACYNVNVTHSIDFFSCSLTCDDPYILKQFKTSPIFDETSKSYACNIQPLMTLDEITAYSRGKNILMVLKVRLVPSGVFDRINLRLEPAVQVTPRLVHIDKLEGTVITISGIESILQKVKIESSHPESLILLPNYAKQVGRLQFTAKVQNAAQIDSDLFIKVHSPATQQTIQIPILPAKLIEDEKADESLISSILSNTGKVVASTILALLIIGGIMMLFQNRDLDTSGVFKNSRNNQSGMNQTLLNNHDNSNNVFVASPLSSQRPQTSPIRMSPTNRTNDLVYGDPTLTPQYRRFKKAL